MPRMIFINLPITDLERAIAFYEAIGAQRNPQFSDATAACMVLSETIHVMLLTHAKFAQFTSKPIVDARSACEVMLCLSAESRAEVEDLLQRATRAGGAKDPTPVQDHGFMYGRSFADPDGHIWEVMWMDLEAAKQAMGAPA
ncbi:VOC family protein [Falsiroseomonas tokyonensis]|uniref:VOC family protein n=1 Tax=Falsiroseomonas tokyonensis TaxID=430521 RepID=A0ABV7BQJ5_9PROT|nr:VOC family protein [Falsiroseomonas tokyonensis]MBU8537814.1 VOC family protein [Falsiroseomonas tokyonensis]